MTSLPAFECKITCDLRLNTQAVKEGIWAYEVIFTVNGGTKTYGDNQCQSQAQAWGAMQAAISAAKEQMNTAFDTWQKTLTSKA